MRISDFELPPNVRWLRMGDQSVFPVYGASGGLVNDSIRYLIKEGSGPMPASLNGADLALPPRAFLYRVTVHERGWKHAAIWDRCDVHSFHACLKELNA